MKRSLFHAICDLLPAPAFLLDLGGRILAANRHAESELGQAGRRLVGAPLADFAQPARLALPDYLRACAGTGAPLPGSIRLLAGDGRIIAYRCYGAVIGDPAYGEERMIFLRCAERGQSGRRFLELNERLQELGSELHHRRRLQERLEKALRERDILLAEIHHRVRNNLQIVTSLLALQAHGSRSEAVRGELEKAQSRVKAIGAVHQHLYAADDLASIDLHSLIADICAQLWQVYDGDGRGIRLEIDLPRATIQMEQAAPLALLVTEAATNALKHAFPQGRPGVVRISLERRADALALRIADDGVGLPDREPSQADEGRRSLGWALIQALAGQLGAVPVVNSAEGTAVEVALPLSMIDDVGGRDAALRLRPRSPSAGTNCPAQD